MEIEILSATSNPMDIIGIAAGTSYGKSDPKHSRVENCIKKGHTSVCEHASVTFRVSGISRACSHQLVRHRMASFVQKSQRYTKVDIDSDWYVIPPEFEKDASLREFYEGNMCGSVMGYNIAIEDGIKPEDARYLLPEACKTELTATMNVRELFHFLSLRTDKSAQWEIRDMAFALVESIADIDEQWHKIMELWNIM